MERYTEHKHTDRCVLSGDNEHCSVTFMGYDTNTGDLIGVAQHSFTRDSLKSAMEDLRGRMSKIKDELDALKALAEDMKKLPAPAIEAAVEAEEAAAEE